jgi:hypothetical protein
VKEAPAAFWNGERWEIPSGTVTDLRPDADGIPRAMVAGDLASKRKEFRRKTSLVQSSTTRGWRSKSRCCKPRGLDEQ